MRGLYPIACKPLKTIPVQVQHFTLSSNKAANLTVFTPGFYFIKPKVNVELLFVLLFEKYTIICFQIYFSGNLINRFSDTMASTERFHDNMTAILSSKHNVGNSNHSKGVISVTNMATNMV